VNIQLTGNMNKNIEQRVAVLIGLPLSEVNLGAAGFREIETPFNQESFEHILGGWKENRPEFRALSIFNPNSSGDGAWIGFQVVSFSSPSGLEEKEILKKDIDDWSEIFKRLFKIQPRPALAILTS